MSEIIDKTIAEIKTKGIKPVPRWHFLAKEWFLWVAFLITVLVGGVAASLIFYAIRNNEWEAMPYLGHNLASFILLTLPYFWIALVIAFAFLADYQLHQTRQGYKYSFVWISMLNFVLALLLGAVLYQSGWAAQIEAKLEQHVPYYEQFMPPRQRLWMNPEQGLLIGRILQHGSGAVLIEDLDGRSWEIKIENDKLQARPVGETVRLIGEKIADGIFRVKDFRPWQGRDPFRKRPFPNFPPPWAR